MANVCMRHLCVLRTSIADAHHDALHAVTAISTSVQPYLTGRDHIMASGY